MDLESTLLKATKSQCEVKSHSCRSLGSMVIGPFCVGTDQVTRPDQNAQIDMSYVVKDASLHQKLTRDVEYACSNLKVGQVVGGSGRGRKIASNGQHDRPSRARKGAKKGRAKGGAFRKIEGPVGIDQARRIIVMDNSNSDNVEQVPADVEIREESEHGDTDLTDDYVVERPKQRELKYHFHASDFPTTNCLLSGDSRPNTGYIQHDCGGQGFCGLVAIDTALGKDRAFKEYMSRAFHDTDDMTYDQISAEAPSRVGTVEYLYEFSRVRGVNLLLLDRLDRLITRFEHHSGWKWVHLRYLTAYEMVYERELLGLPNLGYPEEPPEPPPEPEPLLPGHYFLLSEHYSSHDVVPSLVGESFERRYDTPIPAIGLVILVSFMLVAVWNRAMFNREFTQNFWVTLVIAFISWTWMFATLFLGFLKLSFHRKITFSETMFADSNKDTRNFIDKRDRLKAQECYSIAEVEEWWRVNLFRRIFVVRSPTIFGSLYYCFTSADPLGREPRMVEVERYRVIAGDMVKNSHLCGVEKNLSSYGAIRELNSSSNMYALSTLSVLEEFADFVNRKTSRVAQPHTLTQFNVHGTTAIVPNVNNVVLNQIIGAGFDAYSQPAAQARGSRRNHVGNSEYRQGEDKVIQVALSRRPLYTADGVMTCGIFFHHKEWSALLGAWMTRGMTKSREGQVGVFKGQCIAWGRKMFETIIQDSDVHPVLLTGPFEERNIQSFELAYRKKRPGYWVDKMVNDYRKYLTRKMTRREEEKFRQHGYFVKFESNSKWVLVDGDRRIKGRPRGIMTMSPLMMFECAQCIDLLHQLYATDLKVFQVKNMTPQEVCDAVYKHTQNGMMVTDVSAFESSIDDDLRIIEDNVMFLLCVRAGCMDVYEKYYEWTNPYRKLHTPFGFFMNCTRNSGDFWTSAFNGVDMLALIFFEHVLTYKLLSKSEVLNDKIEFKRIALDKFYGLHAKVEGDDGLVRPGAITSANMAKCGISFSSALTGTRPGDVDFLRSRWLDGKRYINIGRALGGTWLKGANHLSFGKQEFLRRMVALSMYWLQPGHPVLTGWINRTEKETRRFNNFRNSAKYLKDWKFDEGIVSKSFPADVKVDESMRAVVAMGAAGFPPLSISTQIELERMFEQDEVFYVARLFDQYEDVTDRVAAGTQLDTSEDDFYNAVVKSGIKLRGERKPLPMTARAQGQVVAEIKKGK
jgi:hypothetical protein